MTVIVTFDKNDTLHWAKLEDAIGHSGSNRDNGPVLLDLIWKDVPRVRAIRIAEAATQNSGVLAIVMLPMKASELRLRV